MAEEQKLPELPQVTDTDKLKVALKEVSENTEEQREKRLQKLASKLDKFSGSINDYSVHRELRLDDVKEDFKKLALADYEHKKSLNEKFVKSQARIEKLKNHETSATARILGGGLSKISDEIKGSLESIPVLGDTMKAVGYVNKQRAIAKEGREKKSVIGKSEKEATRLFEKVEKDSSNTTVNAFENSKFVKQENSNKDTKLFQRDSKENNKEQLKETKDTLSFLKQWRAISLLMKALSLASNAILKGIAKTLTGIFTAFKSLKQLVPNVKPRSISQRTTSNKSSKTTMTGGKDSKPLSERKSVSKSVDNKATKSGAKFAAIKSAGKFAGKAIARLIPGVGWVMLAHDAFQIANHVSGGKISESLSNVSKSDANNAYEMRSELALKEMQSGESLSERLTTEQAYVERAKVETERMERERLEQIHSAVIDNSTNVINNSTTNTFPQGFSFKEDSWTPNYGAQPIR